jgi:hypothetical protein
MQGNFFNLASRCAACAHRPLCFPALPWACQRLAAHGSLPRIGHTRRAANGPASSHDPVFVRRGREHRTRSMSSCPLEETRRLRTPLPLPGSHAGASASRQGPLPRRATEGRLAKLAAARVSGAARSQHGVAQEISAHRFVLEPRFVQERRILAKPLPQPARGSPRRPALLPPFGEFAYLAAMASHGVGQTGCVSA